MNDSQRVEYESLTRAANPFRYVFNSQKFVEATLMLFESGARVRLETSLDITDDETTLIQWRI